MKKNKKRGREKEQREGGRQNKLAFCRGVKVEENSGYKMRKRELLQEGMPLLKVAPRCRCYNMQVPSLCAKRCNHVQVLTSTVCGKERNHGQVLSHAGGKGRHSRAAANKYSK